MPQICMLVHLFTQTPTGKVCSWRNQSAQRKIQEKKDFVFGLIGELNKDSLQLTVLHRVTVNPGKVAFRSLWTHSTDFFHRR